MRNVTPAGIAAAVLVLAAAVQPLDAQQQALSTARLTLAEARTALDAAEAEARSKGWNLVFVISDAAGAPIYVRRMDGVPTRNYDVALNKISTTITAGMNTADYAAAVRAGALQPITGALLFDGGLVLKRDGQVVGAFSASGASGADDAQAVRAGMAAIGMQPTVTPVDAAAAVAAAAAARTPAPPPTPAATAAPAAPAASAASAPPAAPTGPAVRVPVEVLDRYVGEYEIGPGAFITVRRHGETLTGQPPGQPEFVLDPVSQTRFKVRGTTADIEVEFVTDEAGVMHKVLHQNGQQMRAPRRSPGG